MKKRPVRLATPIVLVLCGTVVLCCVLYIQRYNRQDEAILRGNERYRSMYTIVVTPAPTPETEPSPVPTRDSETAVYALPTEPPADPAFDTLLSVNPDVCGWLNAGSDIDLPVVHRSGDNETYLSVDLEGNDSVGGTLFMDGYNRVYPKDIITIIYGHNMASGEMFGRLRRFREFSYLKENPVITFKTLYENAEYVPFAVFETDPALIDIRYFQPDVEAFNAFIDTAMSMAVYRTGIDVRYGDEILALVTCTSGDDTNRLFVLCRKLRDDENVFTLSSLFSAVK